MVKTGAARDYHLLQLIQGDEYGADKNWLHKILTLLHLFVCLSNNVY
jgi:hypothetical protein